MSVSILFSPSQPMTARETMMTVADGKERCRIAADWLMDILDTTESYEEAALAWQSVYPELPERERCMFLEGMADSLERVEAYYGPDRAEMLARLVAVSCH
ncbi:MAG: hypothetical protein NXI16_07615 [Alphaproteobacteria bacterium]|nr:hypothetical protein [Alphaproteobacteria bacterium]